MDRAQQWMSLCRTVLPHPCPARCSPTALLTIALLEPTASAPLIRPMGIVRLALLDRGRNLVRANQKPTDRAPIRPEPQSQGRISHQPVHNSAYSYLFQQERKG